MTRPDSSLPPVALDRPVPDHWSFDTILDVVRWRAARSPDDTAFTFLADGDTNPRLTYAGLDRRARAVAAELQSRSRPGDRALLVLEPGLDYVAALIGSFYAGIVPVPVYPPDPFRIARTLPRLQAIFGSAECKLLVSSDPVLGGPDGVLRKTCPHGAVAIEAIDDGRAADYRPHQADADALTLLQYTSGTTGEPRGVPISHANLFDNLRGMERVLDVEDAIAVQWLPPYHDLGLIGGVFLPLFAGRQSVLMSPLSFMQNPAAWLRAMSDFRATTSAAPNFGYELCLRKIKDEQCEGLDLSNWRIAVSGAEPVRADTLDRFAERFAPYGFRREAFVPAYGMAETTLMVSVAKQGREPAELAIDADALSRGVVELKPGGRRVVGCGAAAEGIDLRIVDPITCEATDGVGEVWVRGPGVASGYWRRPDATEQGFNQTLLPAGESGFFRTGDLGFLGPVGHDGEGELFLVGRAKEMLIFAGRNFYPQDLELAVQTADPAFKTDGGAAVAVEVETPSGATEEQLVVFQEVHRPKRQDLGALLRTARSAAAEETGVEPYRVVLLPVGELPKTSSGKTRRAECWDLYQSGTVSVAAEWPSAVETDQEGSDQPHGEAPTTDTEQWLAACWAGVLGLPADEPVCRGDNFFALGGRSLQVTQMLTEIANRFGKTLPVRALFDHPTLAQLADHLDRRPKAATSAESNAEPIDYARPQPLSPAQQRFWLIEQVGAEGSANVPLALRVSGTVDRGRLTEALNGLVARHDALRRRFIEESGKPLQQLAEHVPVALEDLPAVDAAGDDDQLDRLLAADWVWRPFDLDRPTLMRAGVAPLGGGEKAIVLVFHHLVCDGASSQILLRDLSMLYGGGTQAAPAAAGACSRDDGSADTDYWSNRLADVPAAIDLPLDRPDRPRGRGDVAVATRPISAAEIAAVERLAADEQTTPFLVYLAAMQQLLARYSGQNDVGVATATSGRETANAGAVGCFINTVPLFATVDPGGESSESRRDFLRRVREQAFADLENGHLPWEAIVAAADKPRLPGRMPLVQAFLIHDDRPTGAMFGPLAVTDAATDYHGLSAFDLSLVVETSRRQPRLKLIHDKRCLLPALAERMLDALRACLSAMAEAPELATRDLPIPAPSEAGWLQAGGEPSHYPKATQQGLLQTIDRLAGREPETAAVECGGDRLTRGALLRRSTQIAAGLQAAGVAEGDRVGLLLDRGADLPAAILGVWRAGAAYVPLDPAYPTARLELMAADAELACVVTNLPSDDFPTLGGATTLTFTELANADGAKLISVADDPNRLAYLMYTSGSTGKPKGVAVHHGAVTNLLHSFAHDTPLGPGDAMLASTTFAFDISVLELLLPLATGALLLVAGNEAVGDGVRLGALMADPRVTHLQGAPSTFRMLRSAGWRPAGHQTVLCGGEEVTPDVARFLLDGAREVWNVYGPTETTVWSARHRITEADAEAASIPLGKPIAGTRCYVLDQQSRLAPIGVWGELAIAGKGVAAGYWRRGELTAERFPRDLFASDRFASDQAARLYLTGDTARWTLDAGGELILEFGGRSDGQVKVRGHRVELREVEIALADHPAIGEAAVVAADAGSGNASLVAFVARANGRPWAPGELLEHLATRLPSYMAPSSFVEVDRLPRTANGKINRKELPLADATAVRSSPAVAPRTPLEEKLAGWVRELLRITEVGVHDNFFELGGQSLLATQLVVRMRDELGAEPPLREVYQRPTIAAWAELILQAELEAGDCVSEELLDQLDGMSDDEAASLLRSLSET